MKNKNELETLVADFESTMDLAIVDFARKWHSPKDETWNDLIGVAGVLGSVRIALMMVLAGSGQSELAAKKGTDEFLMKGLEEIARMVTSSLSKDGQNYSFLLIRQKAETD